jgi:hypothetical protein
MENPFKPSIGKIGSSPDLEEKFAANESKGPAVVTTVRAPAGAWGAKKPIITAAAAAPSTVTATPAPVPATEAIVAAAKTVTPTSTSTTTSAAVTTAPAKISAWGKKPAIVADAPTPSTPATPVVAAATTATTSTASKCLVCDRAGAAQKSAPEHCSECKADYCSFHWTAIHSYHPTMSHHRPATTTTSTSAAASSSLTTPVTSVNTEATTLVIDSGAFIAGAKLDNYGGHMTYFTINDVINELRDPKARHMFQTFPYKITERAVSAEAMHTSIPRTRACVCVLRCIVHWLLM